jgi:hypothetical protein
MSRRDGQRSPADEQAIPPPVREWWAWVEQVTGPLSASRLLAHLLARGLSLEEVFEATRRHGDALSLELVEESVQDLRKELTWREAKRFVRGALRLCGDPVEIVYRADGRRDGELEYGARQWNQHEVLLTNASGVPLTAVEVEARPVGDVPVAHTHARTSGSWIQLPIGRVQHIQAPVRAGSELALSIGNERSHDSRAVALVVGAATTVACLSAPHVRLRQIEFAHGRERQLALGESCALAVRLAGDLCGRARLRGALHGGTFEQVRALDAELAAVPHTRVRQGRTHFEVRIDPEITPFLALTVRDHGSAASLRLICE